MSGPYPKKIEHLLEIKVERGREYAALDFIVLPKRSGKERLIVALDTSEDSLVFEDRGQLA